MRKQSFFSRALERLVGKKVFGQAILADDLLALQLLLVKDTADFVVKGAHAVVSFVIVAIIKTLRKFFTCY